MKKAIFAVVLFCACFALFSHAVIARRELHAKPPPPVPLCDWTDVSFDGNLTPTDAWITTRTECESSGIDGCYCEIVTAVYEWNSATHAWDLLTNPVTTTFGPACESVYLHPVSFPRAGLTPGKNYCLVATAWDMTYGRELIGSGYNYWTN